MSFSDKELDDFWDIDKLVPKKKKYISPFTTEPRTVVYSADGEEDKSREERKLSFESLSGVSETSEESYDAPHGGLVKRVSVKRVKDKYDFYGAFRKAALLYYDYKTDKCDFAPFYSYMPQYSQLGTEQKNYYFYWRDALRHGKYLKSDYSYLYLYVYEILNLPDKIPPEEGLKLLCTLWAEYRASLPRIDSYFALWVQDYSFVYRLPCPTEQLLPFISEAISVSDFKEFYLSDIEKTGDGGTDAMLAYLSDYDWRRGKYAGGEYSSVYKTHMLSVMRRVLFRLDLPNRESKDALSVLRRDAFAHSLCTHAVKCKLTVEYVKLAGNEEFCTYITAAVRYTENKLRALLGIKSRISVKGLSEEHKRIIDIYFASVFETEAKKRQAENLPEYEKLYDAPRETMSFSGADEIEKASWDTTRRLVVEYENDIDTENGPIYTEQSADTAAEEATGSFDVRQDDSYGLGKDDISMLLALLKYGKNIDDSAAERINEAFSDGFGDVILEYDGGSFKIIEDYEEEIAEWLSRIMK